MSLKPIRYPFDKTGKSRDNKVVNEIRTLKPTRVRCFVTNNGGFFTESFVLRDAATGQVLRKGTQYKFDNLYEMATQHTRKEVCGVVVLLDQNVSNTVSYDYQAVGGLYGFSNEAVIQQIEALGLDNRPVEWGNIFNKPGGYAPQPHLHDIGDIYGFEYLVHAIQQLRHAIMTGDEGSHTAIYNYIDSEVGKFTAQVRAIRTDIDNHSNNRNNPHRVTAAQVGTLTTAAINALVDAVKATVNSHVTNFNNPHKVTAAQIGVFTKAEVTSAINTAVNPVKTNIDNHLRDYNNPHRVTASQLGVYTKAQVDSAINAVNLNVAAAKKVADAAKTAITKHEAIKSGNPHKVTAAEVGAYTKAETTNEAGRVADSKIATAVTALKGELFTSSNTANANTRLKQQFVPISTTSGNLITWRGNGLYYGITPPANVANLYVDAVNGVDRLPLSTNNYGTKAAPLKTIGYAIHVGGSGSRRNIWLYEGQNHVWSATRSTYNSELLDTSTINIYPYGPNADAVPNLNGLSRFQNPAQLELNTRITFSGIVDYVQNGRTYRRITVMRTTGNCYIGFHGLRLIVSQVVSGNNSIYNDNTKPIGGPSIFSHTTGFEQTFYLDSCKVEMPALPSNLNGMQPICFVYNTTNSAKQELNLAFGTIEHSLERGCLYKSGSRQAAYIKMSNINNTTKAKLLNMIRPNTFTEIGGWTHFNLDFDPVIEKVETPELVWSGNKLYGKFKVGSTYKRVQIWPAQWSDTATIENA